ncbi:dihydrodipicolinate synthase family protein [Loktanella agnita]|uniref:dihydrodipicolinate synthase family protein n=1 Tax=Loktanella agnita TaxID=287097 RepID=UPI003989970F
MSLFTGLSAFPITPTDAKGQVDTAALRHLLDRITEAGADSIGLLGSTGTYMYLSRAARAQLIRASSDHLKSSTPLIASVGALRTDDAVALAQDARAAGANALLLAPVSYTPLTQEEVYQHIITVADATELPLCIYNNPGTTHFSFNTDLIARLAKHPHIAAIKMPLPANGDVAAELSQLRALVPDDFRIGYSGDWGCAAALLAGADVWFSVVGGILPDVAARLTQAAMAGDNGAVGQMNTQLTPLWQLFQEFGSLRIVYAVAHKLAVTDALPPRPILPVPVDVQKRVADALAPFAKS